jgi:AraC-like protein
MASRIHWAEQHRSTVSGIEAMTLVSNHHFPRHSHDQYGIGVIAFGAQRSWSGVGLVSASAGDVIMVNPGEMHDGVPLDSNPRRWRMIYIDPVAMAREVEEETVGPVEIVRPVACDPLLAGHFARLFACLTAPQSDRLAEEENLLCSLMHVLRRHAVARLLSNGPSPCVAKAWSRPLE